MLTSICLLQEVLSPKKSEGDDDEGDAAEGEDTVDVKVAGTSVCVWMVSADGVGWEWQQRGERREERVEGGVVRCCCVHRWMGRWREGRLWRCAMTDRDR